MTYEDNVREAQELLRFADMARNRDHWRGDRNADSLAAGTVALAHAALAIADRLDTLIGLVFDEGRAIGIRGEVGTFTP